MIFSYYTAVYQKVYLMQSVAGVLILYTCLYPVVTLYLHTNIDSVKSPIPTKI